MPERDNNTIFDVVALANRQIEIEGQSTARPLTQAMSAEWSWQRAEAMIQESTLTEQDSQERGLLREELLASPQSRGFTGITTAGAITGASTSAEGMYTSAQTMRAEWNRYIAEAMETSYFSGEGASVPVGISGWSGISGQSEYRSWQSNVVIEPNGSHRTGYTTSFANSINREISIPSRFEALLIQLSRRRTCDLSGFSVSFLIEFVMHIKLQAQRNNLNRKQLGAVCSGDYMYERIMKHLNKQ